MWLLSCGQRRQKDRKITISVYWGLKTWDHQSKNGSQIYLRIPNLHYTFYTAYGKGHRIMRPFSISFVYLSNYYTFIAKNSIRNVGKTVFTMLLSLISFSSFCLRAKHVSLITTLIKKEWEKSIKLWILTLKYSNIVSVGIKQDLVKRDLIVKMKGRHIITQYHIKRCRSS